MKEGVSQTKKSRAVVNATILLESAPLRKISFYHLYKKPIAIQAVLYCNGRKNSINCFTNYNFNNANYIYTTRVKHLKLG
jgi:hypothetical protein